MVGGENVNKDELIITMTIQLDSWKKQETKNEILDFLKTLNIIKLEMEEK